jgi:N-acetyl-gamma-glutamyl-phosphate reductase
MPTAAILGASGFSGQETLDRVLAHPELDLIALGSDSLAGQGAAALDPRLGRNGYASIPAFVTNDEALASGADVLFLCLEHERAATLQPPVDGIVIDLSGAHRLPAADYPAWYGFEHPQPAGLDAWSYGLPELFPPSGRLVANPGCYATAALLALAPAADAIDPASVVIDAKSGVSGAGRGATHATHFISADENVSPYKIEGHRHTPEIEQELGVLGNDVTITFMPHLLPLAQGELVSCYVTPSRSVDADELVELFDDAYAREPFVELRSGPVGVLDVRDTNYCRISWFADPRTGRIIVFSVIDNLWKGAASQAVQNLNLMFGRPETEGLL